MLQLSDEEAVVLGILTRHEQMDNGEYRFRLVASDGTAYIRTVAGDRGAWQNSHFHSAAREIYIVQSGWMAFAQRKGQEITLQVYRPNQLLTTEPRVSHNVYLPAGAVIHTVKYGVASESDRHADAELDRITKPITEEQITRVAGDVVHLNLVGLISILRAEGPVQQRRKYPDDL
jgi:mannose-6-phosphate isomerase-like protein (cupin superfamily)